MTMRPDADDVEKYTQKIIKALFEGGQVRSHLHSEITKSLKEYRKEIFKEIINKKRMYGMLRTEYLDNMTFTEWLENESR